MHLKHQCRGHRHRHRRGDEVMSGVAIFLFSSDGNIQHVNVFIPGLNGPVQVVNNSFLTPSLVFFLWLQTSKRLNSIYHFVLTLYNFEILLGF